MSEKSEALRLADALDAWDGTLMMPAGWRQRTSAELRRLHEENAELRKANDAFGQRQEWWNERMVALEAQRDALLAALKAFANEIVPNNPNDPIWVNARAAIKMVEEKK